MMTQAQPYPVEEIDSVLNKLLNLKNELKNKHLSDYFAEDHERFQKFSVNFDSNREYDLYSSSPNIAVINIQDTNNSKNAITIKNTSNGKVLISAFANGTSVSGYPTTVDWDYFE